MPQNTIPRRKALITGAAGGMGRACAQIFGATCDLVLSDIAEERLQEFADELRAGGHTVTVHAGEVTDAGHLADLAGEMGDGKAFSVIHTAGVSPSLADWETIMRVNLIGSEMLLDALEPQLVPGSVVVLIASLAGHLMPQVAEIDALLNTPLGDGFVDRMGEVIQAMTGANSADAMAGVSYSLSKRGVHLQTVRKAMDWGRRGVRVVSISPGVIHTPMGLSENENTPGALETMQAAPIARIGTPMDIAMAARFLCSEEAGYISGSDLRVDGGAASALTFPKVED